MREKSRSLYLWFLLRLAAIPLLVVKLRDFVLLFVFQSASDSNKF